MVSPYWGVVSQLFAALKSRHSECRISESSGIKHNIVSPGILHLLLAFAVNIGRLAQQSAIVSVSQDFRVETGRINDYSYLVS